MSSYPLQSSQLMATAISVSLVIAPKGHASIHSQQPVHFSLSITTLPSSNLVIAPYSHDSLHFGFLQFWQTVACGLSFLKLILILGTGAGFSREDKAKSCYCECLIPHSIIHLLHVTQFLLLNFFFNIVSSRSENKL